MRTVPPSAKPSIRRPGHRTDPQIPHRQRAETWSRCLRQRQSLLWRSRRWNCRPSDVSPKRRHPPTLARAIGAGVLPLSGADATVCPGHGLPAEARRRHRSADHPFNGRIAPGLHPHRVASQSIPASSNVGTLPPARRPVPADPPCPARRPNAPGAGFGPPRHRASGPAPHGRRHAPPRGWRSNHTEEGPRQGPLFGRHLHPPRERNARGGPGVERSRAAGAFPDRAPSQQSRS